MKNFINTLANHFDFAKICKYIAIMLVIVMVSTMCIACGQKPDSNEIIEDPKYSDSAKENSLYAVVGNELEINGVVVSAAALCVPVDSTTVTNAPINATFYVDRTCGRVYVYVEEGVGHYATGGLEKTDHIYSGDLIVNGVKIPWLVEPENWQN